MQHHVVRRRGLPYNCYAKRWDPDFTIRRVFKGNFNEPYIDIRRRAGAKGSDLEVFFQRSFSLVPLWKVQVIRELFEDVEKGMLEGEKTAWLDERSFASGTTGGCRRYEYTNKFSAPELRTYLRVPVWNNLGGN